MNQRIIPWGTVVAGGIALGTALLVGLTEIGGVSIPFGSAGPGAVIVVGLLILLAGLVVVLRSGRAARAASTAAEPSTPHSTTSGTPSHDASADTTPAVTAPGASAVSQSEERP